MYFDGHVHDRGGKKQSYKETEAHVLEVAEKAGVDGILVMPNTNPPLTTRKTIEEKLERADRVGSKVFYGIHMGLTADPKQIQHAVQVCEDLFPRVVGMKGYWGPSVGKLGISTGRDQKTTFITLARCDYRGVVTNHCSKKSLLRPDLWDYTNPITHGLANPPEAEFESVRDIMYRAINAEFAGWLHFTHISTPKTIEYLVKTKKYLIGTGQSRLRGISCDTTPNSLFWYDEMMNLPDGITLKVDPPLRTRQMQKEVLQQAKDGKTDFTATDHAPHELSEKFGQKAMSGIPGVDKWPKIARKLKQEGFSPQQIEDLTFNNPVRIFGLENLVIRTGNPGDINLQEYPYGNFPL